MSVYFQRIDGQAVVDAAIVATLAAAAGWCFHRAWRYIRAGIKWTRR